MFVLFKAGNNEFGINMTSVKSIQPAGPINKLHAGKQPMVVVDNETMPLYDLAALLGQAADVKNTHRRLILVNVDGQTRALLVDKVDGVVEESQDHVKTMPPVYKHMANSLFPEVLQRDEKLILLVNPSGLHNYDHLNTIAAAPTAETEVDFGQSMPETDSAPTSSNATPGENFDGTAEESIALHITDDAGAMDVNAVAADFPVDDQFAMHDHEPELVAHADNDPEEMPLPAPEPNITVSSGAEQTDSGVTMNAEEPSLPEHADYAATTTPIIMSPAEEFPLEEVILQAEQDLDGQTTVTPADIPASQETVEENTTDLIQEASLDEIDIAVPEELLPELEIEDATPSAVPLPDDQDEPFGELEELALQEISEAEKPDHEAPLDMELKALFGEVPSQPEIHATPDVEYVAPKEDLAILQDQPLAFSDKLTDIQSDEETLVFLELEEIDATETESSLQSEKPAQQKMPLPQPLKVDEPKLQELEPADAIKPSFFSRLFGNRKARSKRKKAAKRRIINK